MKNKTKTAFKILAAIAAAAAFAASLFVGFRPIALTKAAAPTQTITQLVKNPNIKWAANWYTRQTVATGTYDAQENTYASTLTASTTYNYVQTDLTATTIGHIYQLEAAYKATADSASGYFSLSGNNNTLNFSSSANEYKAIYTQQTAATAGVKISFGFNGGAVLTTIGAKITAYYIYAFDLTEMYGAGNIPTLANFHQFFLGYGSGYTAGMTDGAKSHIVTSIDNWNTEKGSLTISENDHVYNAKYKGSYNSSATNLYWSSSAYSNTRLAIGTSAVIPTQKFLVFSANYFQLCEFTKYLNTTQTDVDFNTRLFIDVSWINANSYDLDITWTTYYTTQSMSSFDDVSSWNVINPIKPAQTVLNNCEVLATNTQTQTVNASASGSGNTVAVDITASRSAITDTNYCIFTLATASTTVYNTGSSGALANVGASYWSPNKTETTFTMDQALSITYEVADLPGLFYTVLTAPFAVMSGFYGITLFPGTPYALNVGSLLMGIIGAAVILTLITWIVKGIKKV